MGRGLKSEPVGVTVQTQRIFALSALKNQPCSNVAVGGIQLGLVGKLRWADFAHLNICRRRIFAFTESGGCCFHANHGANLPAQTPDSVRTSLRTSSMRTG